MENDFVITKKRRIFKTILNPGLPLVVLVFIIACAIFAPVISPYGPSDGDLDSQFIVPAWMEGGSSEHILGTDYYGRDTLSRLIHGARVSISLAFIATVVSALIGISVGLLAGYAGGVTDAVIMRIVDGVLSVPYMMIAILFAAMFGASYYNVIFIIALFSWPMYARQIRAEALIIKGKGFVAMAKISGSSRFRILYRHFLSNVIPSILVLGTLKIGEIIMWEAMLSFLGVGVPAPAPSWGSMTAEGQEYIDTLWWISAIPGFAILLTIFSANIFGDWLRDYLDPKLRQL